MNRLLEIFLVALRLGLTSFGGPIAHLGYFREEYVVRRKWVDDTTFGDLVALCQFLPGPTSSQVGIAIGMARNGLLGGLVSWIGFTLPSALALGLFAQAIQGYNGDNAGWLRGLLIVAVAVVAHAVWGMATQLTPDRKRASVALLAAIVVVTAPNSATQLLLILCGAAFGVLFLRPKDDPVLNVTTSFSVSQRAARIAWALFATLLVGLPLLRTAHPALWVAVVDSFFRVGSLVFGGGHVVLPLLAGEVVTAGWVTDDVFLTGYGAAQAVPGPLFTFAAYLGAAIGGGWFAVTALVAIFLPSFLLVVGALPLWDGMRRRADFRAALHGVNAVVVGILLGALYDPIWTEAIHTPADFSLALAAFGLLTLWRAPAWAVVLLSAGGGVALQALS